MTAPVYSEPVGGRQAAPGQPPDMGAPGNPPPPALIVSSFPVDCPLGPCGATCRACQGRGVIHLAFDLRTLDGSRESVLAGIRQLAVEFGQVAPGAYLRPDGLVVYGVATARRLIDQPGNEPPRPRALRHLRAVQ